MNQKPTPPCRLSLVPGGKAGAPPEGLPLARIASEPRPVFRARLAPALAEIFSSRSCRFPVPAID